MREIVSRTIAPLMSANHIPGMQVCVLLGGRTYLFNFGLAEAGTDRPVTDDTLFELGSISKTFAATLAAYAEQRGALSLTDMAGADLPALRGSSFDHVSLTELGTHMAGGLPLQVPDGIQTEAALLAYLKAWKPSYPPGAMRVYSNTSIGLLGLIAAARLHGDYTALVQDRMFPALGLRHSFISLPATELADYAQGETADGRPIRLEMGVLGPEAYGVRSNAADLLRFLAINMGMVKPAPPWERAVIATHTGYDRLTAGGMIQDLVWEEYRLPVSLAALQAGNGAPMLLAPQPATRLNPPMPPRSDMLLDKTGSTNGFAAYVAFSPAWHAGIVLLANRNYPIPARIEAAYAILTALAPGIAAPARQPP